MDHYKNSTYEADLDYLISNSQSKLYEYFCQMDVLKKDIIELEAQCRFLQSEIDNLHERDEKIKDLNKNLDLTKGKLTELQEREGTLKKDILKEHEEFAALTAQQMHFDLVHKS